jgi:hypothetical protein
VEAPWPEERTVSSSLEVSSGSELESAADTQEKESEVVDSGEAS